MPAAGILGWKRSKYWRPILRNSKSPETPRNIVTPRFDAPDVIQLFTVLAMSFACVLHFAMSSSAFHPHVFQNLHPFGFSRFSLLSVRSPDHSRAPVAPSQTLFHVRVLNFLRMARVLPSGLGIAPVDRLSSFVPFGSRLILQG